MANYEAIAKDVRKQVLTMIHRAGTSHIGSNLSCVDMAVVLYENLKEGDEVVWSKGWAAALIYTMLERQGKITKEQQDSFPNEPFIGLAEPSVNGVHVAGGAMGHGLPVAVGMALAKKRAEEKGNIYCIMSDGEMNEGTTWESAAFAAHHKLDNLVVLIDANTWQAMGKTADVLNFEPLEDKWRAFGWHPNRVDGHNFNSIENSIHRPWLQEMHFHENYIPEVIICDTIKGKGVSFMENHLLYHYKNVSDEEYAKAMEELV